MNDQHDLVDDLVCQCLQARATGDLATVAQLLAAQDPAVRAEVEGLLTTLDRVGLGGDAAAGAAGASALPFGPYLLLERLGAGAMGVVYRARGPDGSECALKLLQPGLLPVRRARLRFDREVQALRELAHPLICPIRDAGEVEGVPFLVMPLLPGENLQAHFARGPARTPADRDRLLALVEALALALHHAHERGFVHRDVKPANVLVGHDGQPIVLDFGLARLDRDDAATLSQSREVIGAPAYMAPEQIADGRAVDRRADVYALGVLLYEGLTGRCPYEAATRESLYRAILTGDAAAPSQHAADLPHAFDVVCLTALAREPDRRYRTAADLAADLQRVRAGSRPLAQLPGRLERTRRWLRRNPLPTTLGALLVTASLVASWQTARVLQRAAGDHARVLAATSMTTLAADPPRAEALAREALRHDPGCHEAATALLAAQAADREQVLRGHTASVTALCYDERGEHLVSASLDGTTRLWNLRSGGATTLLHPGGVGAVALQPRGDLVISGGARDGMLRAFTRDGALQWERRAAADGERVQVLQWSPDGHWLLAGGAGAAVLVDAAGDTREVAAPAAAVTAAAWLTDDVFLLGSGPQVGANAAPTSHWLRAVQITADGVRTTSETAVAAGVRSLHRRPGPRGTLPAAVLIVDAADTASWWSPTENALVPLPFASSKRVQTAAWTPDGGTAFTLSPTGWLAHWRPNGTFLGGSNTVSWAAHLGTVAWRPEHPTPPVEQPACDLVAVAGGFGVVQIRPADGARGLLLGRRQLAALPPAFSPDGTHLATADRDHGIRVWPLFRTDHARFLCGDAVRSAVWCGDDRILTGTARTDLRGRVRSWNAVNGALLGEQFFTDDVARLVASADGTHWLAASGRARRGQITAIADRDGTLRVAGAATALGLRFPVDVATLPDGRLAIAEEDGAIVVLDGPSGAVGQRLPITGEAADAGSPLLAIAATADGRTLWTAGPAGVLHRFDRGADARFMPTGTRRLGEAIRQLECVDDGSLLVAQANGGLHLLAPGGNSGSVVSFAGHRDDVCDVHWTRERGELLVASGDYGGVVRIWRGDGMLVREIRAHGGPVWSVRFSPRGDRLLTGSEDGTARIWEVDG